MNRLKNIVENRFAACTKSARLLIFSADAARRVTTGGWFPKFSFSVSHFRDGFTPPTAEINLTRAQIAKTEIHAPFTGIIGLRNVSEGS